MQSPHTSGLVADKFSDAWLEVLRLLVERGDTVSPRGHECKEITGLSFVVSNMRKNVLVHPARKLSYKFMVAEWLWIWFGRDDVKTISQYNPNIAAFSDNGIDFNGAYGVPILKQWHLVRNTLGLDRDSRQAVLLIYKPPFVASRDVPCTIALQFLVRNERVNIIATMRSSDVWLGLPYDVFNFSMLANTMAAELGLKTGWLKMQLGSSHLYAAQYDAAVEVLRHPEFALTLRSPGFSESPHPRLEDVLVTRQPIDWKGWAHNTYSVLGHPWAQYHDVLLAKTQGDALRSLNMLDQLESE